MDLISKETSESFGYPLVFKLVLWASVIFGLGFAVFLAFHDPGHRSGRFVAIGCALFFGTLALLVAPILRRLPEKILIDDRAITYEAPDGDRTTLPWDQVVRVVDRPVLQRMEVHGADGVTIIRRSESSR
jgi:hypothetical protein